MPDSLAELRLRSFENITWNGGVYIDHFYPGAWSFSPIHLNISPITVGFFEIDDYHFNNTDFSMITTARMQADMCALLGPIEWPSGLTRLGFNGSVASDNFNWPPALTYLYAGNLNAECIPYLPEGLTELTLNGWISCIPNWPVGVPSFYNSHPAEIYYPGDFPLCSVLNSECPGTAAGIAGRVFVDSNGDGQFNVGETGLPSASVTVSPSGYMSGCDVEGRWEIGVLPGSYTMAPSSAYPYVQSLLPAQHSAELGFMGDVDTANHFAATLMPDVQDLRVHLSANPARPGFNNQVHLRCENYGTIPVDAQLTFTFDTDQSWVSSSLAPTSLTANTATWNFPAMPIGAVHNLVVELNTAASVALGTEIIHTLTAEPRSTDEAPGDNSHAYTGVVVGSYDPNDKLLSPSAMSPDQVAAGTTPIEYTIRFQNTGTFLAERVVILDTLSEDLQWMSMRFIASSHAHQWYITDGVLHVIHNDIMLPDSTSDEPGSHGFFTFSMLPATDLQDGATVSNIAHIVFDFNEPIITPPAVFQVDVEAGLAEHTGGSSLRLVPNPAHDRVQVRGEGIALLRYRIIDVLGAQVQAGTLAPNGWVTLDQLADGPYVIEVEQGGVLSSQRFVKQ